MLKARTASTNLLPSFRECVGGLRRRFSFRSLHSIETRNLHANKCLALWCHQENALRWSLESFFSLFACLLLARLGEDGRESLLGFQGHLRRRLISSSSLWGHEGALFAQLFPRRHGKNFFSSSPLCHSLISQVTSALSPRTARVVVSTTVRHLCGFDEAKTRRGKKA